MVFVCNRRILAAAALSLLSCIHLSANASAITAAANPTPTVNSTPQTCEFRTINYITASLPQQCLRSAWSSANSTTSTKYDGAEDALPTSLPNDTTITTSSEIPSQDHIHTSAGSQTLQPEGTPSSDLASSTSSSLPTSTETSESPSGDVDGGELNEASFLSFEEWKKQTLEKAGQANANIGNKKPAGVGEKKRDSESIQNNLDSLGDEGEIDIDFGTFRSGDGGEEAAHASQGGEPENQQDSQAQNEPRKRKDIYRSKDAGKTYKERFSYASFDGGATILKTHPGAKNAKAVLIENKDSYMLSECAAENKFLIIELSEDIWIDTLVLANFEFFSSMIRTFRVSVSDRYPVKMEKWKDIGTYEARNSREIQAFLIENPQIWARYIRVEFLSHYGNEYYCPLSLVRVHGTRMLESWKETEAAGDEDDSEDIDEQGSEEHFIPDAVAIVVQEEEKLNAELKEAQAAMQNVTQTPETTALGQDEATLSSNHLGDVDSYANLSFQALTNPWNKPDDLFSIFDRIYSSNQASIICQISDSPLSIPEPSDITTSGTSDSSTASPITSATAAIAPATTITTATTPTVSATQNATDSIVLENGSHLETASSSNETVNVTSSNQESIASTAASITNKSQNVTSSQRNKTTSTSSSASPLPTIQESFFKAVSRRLQLLEANSTLSLKYIEEQSKILREAFSKVEKKQLQKTETFLDTLNSTVLAELRGFRQQYDEIWQSTVISLESQREESKREILAVSTRLNILADEVVFQKRMSIIQSVLLLLCLGLIIFSRVSVGGPLDFQAMQLRARNSVFQASLGDSPLQSPSLRRTASVGSPGEWINPQDGDYPLPRPQSGDYSPPTSVSAYSRSENALTPLSTGDYSLMDPVSAIASGTSEYSEHATPPTTTSPQSVISPGRNDHGESVFLSPSSAGTLRRREGFARQQATPPRSGIDPDLVGGLRTSIERPIWVGQENSPHGSSPHLPSPPPEGESEGPVHYITRKPLPALPRNDG